MALRRWLQKRARKNARKKQGTSLDMRMQQAGIPLQGSEFLLLLLVLFAIVLIVGWILTGSAWNGVVIGAGVCMAAWFYVLHCIKSRHDAFVHQLGDCLSLVANALRAGFSFLQTMELISREMQPPMNTEFGRVVRETSLGVPMEQALRRMEGRVNSPDFSLIVTAVIIQGYRRGTGSASANPWCGSLYDFAGIYAASSDYHVRAYRHRGGVCYGSHRVPGHP